MTNKNKLNFILFLNTLVLLFFNLAHPVTPAMLEDKGVMDSLNGILFALMSFGQVIASPFWGNYINKLTPKRVMIISLVMYGLMQQIFAFSPGALGMSFGRFTSGIFASAWIVSGYVYVNHYSDEKSKTKYFGYILVSSSLAAIIGQLISGFLGTQINIYIIFIIQFLGLLVVVIVVWITIENFEVEQNSKVKENKFYHHFTKLKQEGNLSFLIVLLLSAMALSAYTSQAGYFVSDTLGEGTFFVSIINSYSNLIILIMNFFFVANLEKKLGGLTLLIFEFSISILGIILLFFVRGEISLIPITFYLIGIVMTRPIIQKIVVVRSKFDSSEILGYANSANALGVVLGASLSGIFYQIHPQNVLIFILCSLIMGMLVLFTSKKRKN